MKKRLLRVVFGIVLYCALPTGLVARSVSSDDMRSCAADSLLTDVPRKPSLPDSSTVKISPPDSGAMRARGCAKADSSGGVACASLSGGESTVSRTSDSVQAACFSVNLVDKKRVKAIQDSLWRDSVATLGGWRRFNAKVDRFTSTRFYRMTYLAVPLIAAGTVINAERYSFGDLRNTYLPTFRHQYDDYVQYLPMATVYALKIAGVKGRSSWGRMLTSHAFAGLLTFGVVTTLKKSISQMRPDGSQDNSFPSGHTATAFMAATMLHKEYGMTRSPWYSIGGYSVATFVGVSRQMNNKHWLSDVLVGAGIGILTTELGYYFADLIFKERGLVYPERDFSHFNYNRKSSFFGLYVGFNWMNSSLPTIGDLELHSSTGAVVGLEGAWFITRHVGVGARLILGSLPFSINNDRYFASNPGIEERLQRVETSPMRVAQVEAGPYFNVPLSGRWSVGSKLLLGYYHLDGGSIQAVLSDQRVAESKRQAGGSFSKRAAEVPVPALSLCAVQAAAQSRAAQQEVQESYQPMVSIGNMRNFGFGSGLSLTYIANRNFGVRFFYDCNFSPVHCQVTEYTVTGAARRSNVNHFLVSSILGASVNIYFW